MMRERKILLLSLLFFTAFFVPVSGILSQQIVMNNCTGLVVDEVCRYNADYGTNTILYQKRFDPAASVVPDGPNKGAFVVTVGSTLIIDNFGTFVDVCTNGGWAGMVHAVDLFDNNVKVADNDWVCNGGHPSCFGGPLCEASEGAVIFYTFLKSGVHRMKIVWDKQNNGQCGSIAEEFTVIVVNPVVSINGSDDQIIQFKKGDENKTAIISWTLTNTSPDRVLVKTITALNCDANAGIKCEFVGLKKIEPPPPSTVFPQITITEPKDQNLSVKSRKVKFDVKKGSLAINASSISVDLNNSKSVFDSNSHCSDFNGNKSCAYSDENLVANVHSKLTVSASDVNANKTTVSSVFRFDLNTASPAPSKAIVSAFFADGNTDSNATIVDVNSVIKKSLSPGEIRAILSKGPSGRIELILEQGENIIVLQKVTLSKPGNVPVSNIFSSQVIFGDVFGVTNLETISRDNVKITRVFSERKQFNVELIAGDQAFCIGRGGRLGSTGATAVPRVLLSWNWADIEFNSCDQKGAFDSNSVFCDPTQFSIALLKRLERIRKLAADGNVSSASSLSKFSAFLMTDNISLDFRKDFDFYYTQAGFFNASAFYEDPETPWQRYFTNPGRLRFFPESITAGLYSVEIIVDVNAAPFTFFSSQGPIAIINVKLDKISSAEANNPWYSLPFNASVGLYGQDADGKIERKDYGVKFSSSSARKIPINSSFNVDSNSGKSSASVRYVEDFSELNIFKSGDVLFVRKDASELSFLPGFATPIAIVLIGDANKHKAEAYYRLSLNNVALPIASNFAALWSGFGSTPMQCKNFDESTIYYRKNDSKAGATSCVDLSLGFDNFGFGFLNVPQQNSAGRVFLETVFFTPLNFDTRLHNACPTALGVFASPTQGPLSGQFALELKHTSSGASLKEVFEKIKTGELCSSIDDTGFSVWWNQQRISADLNKTKETLISQSPTPVICKLPPETAVLPG